MKDIYNLCERDKDTILSFLLYHMNQDIRRKLSAEHPVQYNRLIGREVVLVRTQADYSRAISDFKTLVPNEVVRIWGGSCTDYTREYIYASSNVVTPATDPSVDPNTKAVVEEHKFIRVTASEQHAIYIKTWDGNQIAGDDRMVERALR